MQTDFVSAEQLAQSGLYAGVMHPGGRPTQKTRTALGQRLTLARERAGISQKELAQQLNTTQQRIAYWERHATGFRSEATIAKLTTVFGISADEILGTKPPRATASSPAGRARRLFDAISKLPRRQQEKILDILEPFVREQTPGKD